MQLAPEPRGHWSGHLSIAFAEVVAALALIAAAGTASCTGWVRLILPLVIVGLLLGARGDLQVAESIWKTDLGDERVSPSIAIDPAGFVTGHDRAESGQLIAWVGSIAYVGVVGLRRKVRPRTAVIGLLFAIAPPWILGGVGALFVTLRSAADQRHGEPGRQANVSGSSALRRAM
jgi:hypothetical protein